MTTPGDTFWSRDVDDILAGPRDVLKDHVVHYYQLVRDEELDQITLLKAATDRAKDNLSKLDTDMIKERLDNLEDSASPSFFEVALGLALAGAGGVIAAAVLQKVVGRMLRSRLLIVTTVSKVRLPMESASPANLAKLRAVAKQHGRKIGERKHFYKLTGPAKEINLDPNSWESILLTYGPDIVGGSLAGAAVEAKARETKTYESTVDFFADRKSNLDGQILPVKKSYHDLLLSMSAALSASANTEPDALARRDIVETIKDNRSFMTLNDLAHGAGLAREDNERVLAQPVFTAGVAMSYFVPVEILEARKGYTVSDIVDMPGGGTRPFGVITVPALPRRPKANSAENTLLVQLAKILFVPSQFRANRLVTMFDEYKHQALRPQLEVVIYFNDVRLEQYAPKWESIRDYLRSALGADNKES